MKKPFFSSSCLFVCCLFILSFSHLSNLMGRSPIPVVPFDQSMARNYNYSYKFSKRDPTWRLYRELFTTYSMRHVPKDAQYLIPKIIHFVWLGSPLPERCKKIIDSWKKFHPTWQIKLWTDADVDLFKLENRAAFDKAINYGEKSDIWRYEILRRFGGLYVDTDFECLQPFDNIHKSCELYAGIAYTRATLLYNGLIGATPRHPILELCVKTIRVGPGDQDRNRIMGETGPCHFTYCFNALAAQYRGKVVPFPSTYLYPFPNTKRRETDPTIIKKRWLKPESLALHYWATSWVVRKPQNNKPKRSSTHKHSQKK